MEDELITLSKSELHELLSTNNSKMVIVSKPITSNLLFKSAAINNSDIRSINEMYKNSRTNNVDSYSGTTYSRHQTFNYNSLFDRKKLEDDGPSSSEIHDLIRKLTLAIMGEKLNKNLSYEDWSETREDYIQIKELFLNLYKKRLDNISKVGD